MGIHDDATAVLNYDGTKGWLIGEEHLVLSAMFVMMNGARLGVAIQGHAGSEVVYQNAAAYAKEGRQYAPGDGGASGPADRGRSNLDGASGRGVLTARIKATREERWTRLSRRFP